MNRHDEYFAPQTLDEQLEGLSQKQGAKGAMQERRVVQNLHMLHAIRAEHEQQILERVRLRLAALETKTQKITEEEDVSPEPSESNSIPTPLPKPKRNKHFSALLQTVAAVLFVGLLGGSFLVILSLSHQGTNTSSGLAKNWHIVSSPHIPIQQNHLWAVSASSENNVWAVGFSFAGSHSKTLIERWDGKKWNIASNPNPESNPQLQGVAAISSKDVWVVGTGWSQHTQTSIALIEHWNGKQWSIVQSPNPGSKGSSLNKVVAITANDVWAVGTTSDANTEKTLIEHWNGKQWSVVPCPSPTSIPAYLTGITAISANDIWAVGYLIPSNASRRSLLEHWNGKAWSIVDAPNLTTGNSQLFNVSAISSDDVWAVGTVENGSAKPLIEHWNGKQWSASSVPPELENSFNSIVAISASDVWAVGSTNNRGGPPTLFVHWDGTQWNTVQVPSASAQCQNELVDITSVPQSTTLWAVGDYVTSCSGPSTMLIQPLFERYTS